MSRQTNNSSGHRKREEQERPRSASPSSSDAPSLADNHVASASLPDLLSPPSHEAAREGEFLPSGAGTEATSSSLPDGVSSQPLLLRIVSMFFSGAGRQPISASPVLFLANVVCSYVTHTAASQNRTQIKDEGNSHIRSPLQGRLVSTTSVPTSAVFRM